MEGGARKPATFRRLLLNQCQAEFEKEKKVPPPVARGRVAPLPARVDQSSPLLSARAVLPSFPLAWIDFISAKGSKLPPKSNLLSSMFFTDVVSTNEDISKYPTMDGNFVHFSGRPCRSLDGIFTAEKATFTQNFGTKSRGMYELKRMHPKSDFVALRRSRWWLRRSAPR